MPITKRARGAAPDINPPDYERALRPVRQLGLPADDPVMRLATMVVRRTRTRASSTGYGRVMAQILTWFQTENIEPLAARREDLLYWWNSTGMYAPKTRLNLLAVIKSFYREAIELELVVKDPTRAIEPVAAEVVTETPALTEKQANRLITSIVAELGHPDRDVVARRDLVIVALAMRMCLRVGEITDLRGRNIVETDGERFLTFLGKWQKPARMAIPEDVWEAIVNWRTSYERSTGVKLVGRDPLVVGLSAMNIAHARARRDGVSLPPLNNATVSKVAMDRLHDIGLNTDRMAAHALRATGATLAYENGADLAQCQALLRHSSLETTRKHYLKRIDRNARPGMERMPIRIGSGVGPEERPA